MIVIRYIFHLIEPLLATGLEGDPNTKSSLNYIPGSMVRGALIGQYLRGKNRELLDARGEVERRLFLDDTTKFLNAYPAKDLEGEQVLTRLLPTPLSLYQDKAVAGNDLEEVYDFTIEYPDLFRSAKAQAKAINKSFCWLHEDELNLHSPNRLIQIHTARSRVKGRAMEADGAVFQYDALAPRQTFGGFIFCDQNYPKDAEMLLALLQNGTFSMGGSRVAGYGRIRVQAEIDDEWQGEAGNEIASLSAKDKLRITCLSPLTLRGPHGEPTADLLVETVAKLLGLPASALTSCPSETVRKLISVGGFNRAWGLPMPQQHAVAPGSVFSFDVHNEISAEALLQLQNSGIGEQQIDGFGRVAINWQQEATLRHEPILNWSYQSPAVTIEPVHASLVRQMGQRILRREVEQSVAARVQDWRLKDRTVVSNSLISRLRTTTRRILFQLPQMTDQIRSETDVENLAAEVFEPLQNLLKELKPTAADQLTKARFKRANKRLSAWLEEQMNSATSLWPDEIRSPEAVILGNETIAAPAGWKVEYTLRLIDGVLAQAAKEGTSTGTPPSTLAAREETYA